jgi:spermidine synthase
MAFARRLDLAVFLIGAGTLATEIAASRLLAPYFGSSTVVWANIIGLTLAYLALGYWLGGKVADRRPEPTVLARIVLIAAAALVLTPFAARPILDVAVRGFDAVSVGSIVGSFLAAMALFAVPITALGAAAPFAVRLAVTSVDEAGSVAGRLYAFSTAGSLVGTFVAALVLIPFAGTQRTLVAVGASVALAAALLAGARWLVAPAAAAALLLVPAGYVKQSLFETESQYQFIRVLEEDGVRELELNEGVAVHSEWRPDSVLTGGYWDLFLLLPPLLDRAPTKMLVVGNAGGTVARAYGRYYPGVEIDGVEIDGELNDVARRFFGAADNPRLRLITADGRPFLEGSDERYDVIVVDAYRQPYVPFQLATREFFETARAHLRPGGLVALNVAATPDDRRLTEAIETTVLSAFPQAWRWSPLRFTDVVVALDRPLAREELLRRVEGVAPTLRSLVAPLRAHLARAQSQGRALTDDRAPVEWLTDRMIFAQIARGEGLDEDRLPTEP